MNEFLEDHVTSPARKMFAITPSDSVALAIIPKAIRCDVGGTVRLLPMESSVAVDITMVAGEVLPVRPKIVYATGTAATLHGLS